jgi:preprotein translocase subunit SecE
MDRGGDEPMAEGTARQRSEGETMAKTNPAEFLKQVQAEGRKVVWPSRQETIRTAIFVGIMMVILAIFFLGIDSLFGAVVQWLLSLA